MLKLLGLGAAVLLAGLGAWVLVRAEATSTLVTLTTLGIVLVTIGIVLGRRG